MNNKLASHVLRCLADETPAEALKEMAQSIVATHNKAVTFGFLDLPIVNYGTSYISTQENTAEVVIRPKSGTIDIDELYNIRSAWGANDLYVSEEGITLVFKK